MKRDQKSALLATAILAIAATASAGTKYVGNVYINTANRSAFGYLGSARNSADNKQLFYCIVSGGRTSDGFVWCHARDSAGVERSCGTDVRSMIEAVMAVNGDSSVEFGYRDDGYCSYISVMQTSAAEPKVK